MWPSPSARCATPPCTRGRSATAAFRCWPTTPSGETLRQLALAGAGIVCLSDFMTLEDRRSGRLMPLFVRQSLDIRQAIHAVYDRNTALSSRFTSFLDHVVQRLGPRAFER